MAMNVVALVFLAQALPALTDFTLPPRAWNSYDGFGTDFNETLLNQQSDVLQGINQIGGNFSYVIIDEGWASSGSSSNWILDAYGRPTFNTQLYPTGMPALAAKMAAKGLQLGLWMIRGIPKMAADQKLPILGTPYTAADIAVRQWACPWHSDVWGVNMSHPGGQAYYNSVVALYASWGIKYLKADCMFGARDMLNPAEIVGLSNAVSFIAPTQIRLGLSPGVAATPKMADEFGQYVNGYRITDDLWDCWSPATKCGCPDGINIARSIDALVNFQTYIGAPGRLGPSYPDPDSLPLGLMRLGDEHMSSLGRNQAEFVYVMWSITGSVFVLGGDITSTQQLPWLRALYTNNALASLHQSTFQPRTVAYNASSIIWTSLDRYNPTSKLYVAVFSYSTDPAQQGGINYALSYSLLDIPSTAAGLDVYDVLNQQPLPHWSVGTILPAYAAFNHVAVFALTIRW